MNNRRNYYRILHLQLDAPNAVIKASYRAMMLKLKLHPDLGGDEWNATLLNEAYATLSNEKKRAAYDLHIQNSSPSKTSKQHFAYNQVEQNTTPILRIKHNEQQCMFCGTDIIFNSDKYNVNNCSGCDSPLESSTRHLHSICTSGRALERQLQNAPLKYFTASNKPAQFGVLRNLSPLGLQFQLSEPLENDQIIKLICDALTAIVRIKNCKKNHADGLYVVGVEFLTSRFNQRRGTFFSQAAC